MKRKIKLGIIDYGLGNINSIKNVFLKNGVEDIVYSRKEAVLSQCDALFLPGVGAFEPAINSLKETGLIPFLEEEVLKKKKPIMAICLGMQLLFENSQEGGNFEGLGWIPGNVTRFKVEYGLRIPHMGWNEISIKNESFLFNDVPDDLNFYFVHSYHVNCPEDYILASCHYGEEFPCVIQRENIFGAQFHPEKSQLNGIRMIENFIKYCERS